MALDPTIPLQAGTGAGAPVNPLERLGQLAGIGNALQTGENLKVQNQLLQTSNAGQQQTQLMQRLHQQLGLAGSLLSLRQEGPTEKEVTDAAVQGVNQGIFKAGEIAPFLAQMPKGEDARATAARKGYLAQKASQLLSAQDQMNRFVGQPGVMNLGDVVQPIMQSQFGTRPVGQPAALGLSPESATAPTELPSTPGGQPVMGTRAGFINQTGTPVPSGGFPSSYTPRGTQAAGGAPPMAQPQQPQQPQQPPQPMQSRPVGQPQGQPQALPQQPPQGGPQGLVMRPPPGTVETMADSAKQFARDQELAGNYRQRIFPLAQAADALRNTNTGPGTESINHLRSAIIALAPDAAQKLLPAAMVDKDKTAAYDEAVKYLANYALQQPGAARSDMATGLAQVANASTHISNKAAQNVVTNALGLERMKQAAYQQFVSTYGREAPQHGNEYAAFLANFATNNDPRGFAQDRMSPEERASLLAKMPVGSAERSNFLNSIRLAERLNLF